MITFYLRPIPPFRLDLTAWALRRLSINLMDRWDGNKYRRTLVAGNDVFEISIDQKGMDPGRPELRVAMDGPARHKKAVADILRKTLGMDIDLSDFYKMASMDGKLEALVRRFAGLKPPRFPSVFEALINGFACQQLSLSVGIHLLNRISAAYGAEFKGSHAFPGPEGLAKAATGELRNLGYSTKKAENAINAARKVISGELDLEALQNRTDSEAMSSLLELPGVGRWTAEYVMLRGLGRLDIFPADDLGGQNRLMEWLRLKQRPGYDAIHSILDRWRPYRGFLYFHLLLESLAQKGLLSAA